MLFCRIQTRWGWVQGLGPESQGRSRVTFEQRDSTLEKTCHCAYSPNLARSLDDLGDMLWATPSAPKVPKQTPPGYVELPPPLPQSISTARLRFWTDSPILCAFLLTESAYLDLQSLIPVGDHPLCVSAHRPCVTGSTDLIPVADHPRCVSAHRRCVSELAVSHSHC